MTNSRINPRTDDDAVRLMLQAAGVHSPLTHTEVIPSLDMLRAVLIAQRIDLSLWGMNHAKSVEHLWAEIEAGEVWLATEPFRRVLLGVAQVIIRQGDEQVLLDAEQILNDGRQRARNRPPTEKMLPGESYRTAALRCLDEEMGVANERVTLLPDTYRVFKEIRTSQSYPGLLSQYTIHKVEVEVRDMPDHDFWTVELGDHNDHVVKNHFWAWRLPVEAAD